MREKIVKGITLPLDVDNNTRLQLLNSLDYKLKDFVESRKFEGYNRGFLKTVDIKYTDLDIGSIGMIMPTIERAMRSRDDDESAVRSSINCYPTDLLLDKFPITDEKTMYLNIGTGIYEGRNSKLQKIIKDSLYEVALRLAWESDNNVYLKAEHMSWQEEHSRCIFFGTPINDSRLFDPSGIIGLFNKYYDFADKFLLSKELKSTIETIVPVQSKLGELYSHKKAIKEKIDGIESELLNKEERFLMHIQRKLIEIPSKMDKFCIYNNFPTVANDRASRPEHIRHAQKISLSQMGEDDYNKADYAYYEIVFDAMKKTEETMHKSLKSINNGYSIINSHSENIPVNKKLSYEESTDLWNGYFQWSYEINILNNLYDSIKKEYGLNLSEIQINFEDRFNIKDEYVLRKQPWDHDKLTPGGKLYLLEGKRPHDYKTVYLSISAGNYNLNTYKNPKNQLLSDVIEKELPNIAARHNIYWNSQIIALIPEDLGNFDIAPLINATKDIAELIRSVK